jgi:hypothetical protein
MATSFSILRRPLLANWKLELKLSPATPETGTSVFGYLPAVTGEEEGKRSQEDALAAGLAHMLLIKRAQVAGADRRKNDPKSERGQDHEGPFNRRVHETELSRNGLFF